MVENIRERIIEANLAYREGNPLMSDSEYDILLEELSMMSPDDDILSTVGHSVKDASRKSKLPIEMASMNKIKSVDDISSWVKSKSIPNTTKVVITPKYDGISLCVNEFTNEAWTRGDGKLGQKSDGHYKMMDNKLSEQNLFNYTYGEVMMPKGVFVSKYSKEFANPRNLVAGLLNSKDISKVLNDCKYVKYGGVVSKELEDKVLSKSYILNALNKSQDTQVQFEVSDISTITESFLLNLFKLWSKEFEIDGLIIEVDDLTLQKKLGRETSSKNPVWARAFKHPSFEQSATTDVIGISWNISKQGYLKPVLHIDPVQLDGVRVSNVTGNNARFVKDMGLGIGSKVVVKRSGMVIPIIADVIKRVDFVMPDVPNIDWNDNGVELVTLTETDDQKLKKLISFFSILESDNVSEGVITQLWEAGHTSIKDILNLKPSDLEKIDRFGKRKAKIVYESIQKSVNGVSLSKLQHATGIFPGLGSRKLVLLEHFTSKPNINDVIGIEGFAEISAKSYVDNYDLFFEFIKDLPIKIQQTVMEEPSGNKLEGKVFVFTGVRRGDLEEIIKSNGGKIGSSVSKNTTHLVMKIIGSGSSKEKKAIELGIEIMDDVTLEKQLNKL